MANKNSYILWLPGWYPNKIEPFAGDFLQRHARAVSLHRKVYVIHILRDKEGTITRKTRDSIQVTGNLSERIIYYYSPVFRFRPLERILSLFNYSIIYRRAIRDCIQKEGMPVCTHVHIANKNALAAWWIKRKYNIPFVISEQWTIFLPEAKPGFNDQSFLFRYCWKKILAKANGLSVVSNHLGKSIQALSNNIPYTVIPNVVDGTVFYPSPQRKEGVIRFIHISGLNYQKNFDGILEALAIVKRNTTAFQLEVFGPVQDKYVTLSKKLGIQDWVHFNGEVTHDQLSVALRNADALILYSRYETFGCVLIEATASGIPVITSDYPVIHEIIEEKQNGYFAEGENPYALAKKIEWFIAADYKPDRFALHKNTMEKYSPEKTGKQFSDWYDACITEKAKL